MRGKLFSLLVLIFFILGSSGFEFRDAEAIASQQFAPKLGPPFQIWDDAGDNSNPVVTYNPKHDEYLVVWVTDQDEFSSDIWGRRLRGDGSPVPNGWFNIDNFAGIHLVDPAVAYNSQLDQYLVVYSAQLSSLDDDIWGKIVNWNGVLSNRFLIDARMQRQNDPAAVYNPTVNQFLVAYNDWQSSNKVDVRLQTINHEGGSVNSTSIVSGTDEYRGGPDLAYNPVDNRYLIVYGLEALPKPSIRGKVFSASLGSLSPEFHYNDDGTIGTTPKIACRQVDCLVAWNNIFSSEIKARRISLDGTPLGPAGGFDIWGYTENVYNKVASVSLFEPWGYLITWDYFLMTTADEGDIFGSVVGFGEDEPMGDSFPLDNRVYYQAMSDLACGAMGRCLLADSNNPIQSQGGDLEIDGRLVNTPLNFIPLVLH